MQQLSQALISFFNTTDIHSNHNSFYSSINGRLYNTMAPTNVTFPYSVFGYVSDTAGYNFDSITDEILLQFSIYSTGGSGSRSTSEIENIYDSLIALWDPAILTLTGYGFGYMNRVQTYNLGMDDLNIWSMIVEYRIFLQQG